MYQFFCGVNNRNLGRYRRSTRAVVGYLFAAILAVPAHADESQNTTMTLGSAVQLALSENPELQVYRFRELGLQGLARTANLRPQLELSAEAENFGGTDDFNGTDGAEFTLALSSVIELGGKRDARVAAVHSQRKLFDGERQALALDLMGEVTRRYVDVVAAQARLDLAANARTLATEVVESVERRTQAGAAPEAELLRARAQLAQAQLQVRTTQNRLHASRLSLSVLWGDVEPDFVRVDGSLANLGSIGDFEALFQRAVENPAITSFASEERLREAELQLAQTQSRTDIGWSVGIRQFQDTNDTALVAGLSIPLNTSGRNAGALQSARAARDEVSVRRESAMLALRARLFEAYQQRRLGIETASSLREDVIPALTRALQQTQAAYESGRYGYQEWMAARQELISAEYALIDAAAASLQNGATIEQLTSEPLLPSLEPGSSETEQETE
ncbi:TolC family protein [Halieaceae bacterium IMCC14734]|uniref:TolC family protein n=1 Tax=Candidatus Litorirhabdus singularis TaxID=2518993 RepID=A0ABT3TK67_9GAMM|nr:TolC family protein [Candidatus Litorirhabdus singularis]MCX2982689.1 TolC family protein [Candidatus Litorirhabdus singularis]